MKLSDTNQDFLERLLKNKALHIEDDIDSYDCNRFWDSDDVLQWFSLQGYTLYKRQGDPRHPGCTFPALPFASFQEAGYLDAGYSAYPVDGGDKPKLTAVDFTGRIIFAQDSRNHHVAIKATHVDSEEYHVLNFLNKQGKAVLKENCILPPLELLYYNNACFVVMPRWGSFISETIRYQTLKNALKLMHCTLKSLKFLHSHYIIHRDLSFGNIVVNHFGPASMLYRPSHWPNWAQRLSGMTLEYALIDFDSAKALPAHVEREKYRLPAQESYVGTHFPEDTRQGEFEYNPFAYDVGALGIFFSAKFQHHSKDIPLLAPFLDKLSARDPSRRFTADEALRFLEHIITESTEDQLSIDISLPPRGADKRDKWDTLPIDFQKRWAAFREPASLPITTRAIRVFLDVPWIPGYTIVRSIRWFLSRLTMFPGLAWKHVNAFITHLCP